MKFVCGNCKAKYQIADDRVTGRTLRMTCRRCGEEIIIRGQHVATGPASAPPAPAASGGSALGADFRRQATTSSGATPAPLGQLAMWHVAINDIPVGPMRRDELARKITAGAVNGDSLAWRDGMEDWLPLKQIPDLTGLLQRSPPPPPAAATEGSSRAHLPPPVTRTTVPPGGEVSHAGPSPDSVLGREGSGLNGLDQLGQGRQRPQSWAVMFGLVSGGAFIMMVGIVLGVKFLGGGQAPPPSATTAPATATAEAALEPGTDESLVVLEEQEIEGAALEEEAAGDAPAKSRRGAEGASKKAVAAKASNGKKLSAEEQAMLARMGGGLEQGPSNIRTRNRSKESDAPGGRGLSAAQLRNVVRKGQPHLQRCYETALRSNPTNETVRLDVDLTVGTSGKVTSVGTRGRDFGNMGKCIERTVRLWRFPAASSTTRTSFPVVFQPGA